MAEQSYTPKKYFDFISAFPDGMNSGESPLLLKKSQLSFAVNVSLRDGFAHPRPPFVKRALNFNGNTGLQTLLNSGLFQGGGYYRPDIGTELLLAQSGGHLISFKESGYGGSWNVTDISVPGSYNSASATQCWMWQAEKWMIVNDGTGALPIFFDGVSSRRSYGETQILGTAIAFTPSSPPAIGNNVLVTLNGPYSGPLNVPVIFNGAFYQVIGNVQGYEAQLTNVSDTAGDTQVVNSNVVYNPQIAAVTSAASNANCTASSNAGNINSPSGNTGFFSIYVDSITGINPGANLVITYAGITYLLQVTTAGLDTCGRPNIGGNLLSETPPVNFGFGSAVPIGVTIYFQGNTSPSVVVGVLNQAFTAPAVGSTVNVFLDSPYTGPANERVTINGAVYSIQAIQGAAGATQIYLLNGADTSTRAYVNPSTIKSVPELFAGRMGCYGMGRNWFCGVNGTEYFAGDIVGGGSGTSAYNYRDAVLKMTENDFLSGGGAFSLPGSGDFITAMVFPPVLDTSLGVGSLQIFTAFSAFANNVPADRTTWASLTWPIQTESLKDQGALGQNSTFLVNGDVFFRSDFSLCSLVLARRQFQLNQWGNKPIANEMRRIIELDNQSLLPYGSGVSFDNRALMTAGPIQDGIGVYHPGIISLNMDELSSLRVTNPPNWEGVFEGINVLQMLIGRVNGLRRCFAFTSNQVTRQLELYEFLAESVAMQQGIFADNNSTPIVWMFETAAMFNQDVHQLTELIQLRDGEIYLSGIQGTVNVEVFYRPDFYECWTLWNSFTVCATDAAGSSPSYRTRVGLGEPDAKPVEVGNNRPLRQGYFFQFRFVITGYCTFNGMRVSAQSVPQPVFAPVGASPVCDTVTCETVPDLQLYSLQSPPWEPAAS